MEIIIKLIAYSLWGAMMCWSFVKTVQLKNRVKRLERENSIILESVSSIQKLILAINKGILSAPDRPEPDLDEERFNYFMNFLESQNLEATKEAIPVFEEKGWKNHAKIMKSYVKNKEEN